MTVWLVGHPCLGQLLSKAPFSALASRVHLRMQFEAVKGRERFASLIRHGLQNTGCTQTILSDSGLELLLQGS